MTATNDQMQMADLANELANVASVLLEIERRWPIQARGWGHDRDRVISWSRAMTETAATTEQIRRGLAALAGRPYPPSIGALIHAGSARASIDAEACFRRAVRAAGKTPPAWHALTPLEYAAARAFGGCFELRNATTGDLSRWEKIIDRLAGRGDLPDPPPAPVAALIEYERGDLAVGKAALAQLYAMLGRTPKRSKS